MKKNSRKIRSLRQVFATKRENGHWDRKIGNFIFSWKTKKNKQYFNSNKHFHREDCADRSQILCAGHLKSISFFSQKQFFLMPIIITNSIQIKHMRWQDTQYMLILFYWVGLIGTIVCAPCVSMFNWLLIGACMTAHEIITQDDNTDSMRGFGIMMLALLGTLFCLFGN